MPGIASPPCNPRLVVFHAGFANLVFCPFAHYIQLALEGIFVHAGSATWNLNPTNKDWNTASNWKVGSSFATAPPRPNDNVNIDCKYPPAKPGALGSEPLEAVGGVADAAP